MRYLFLVLIVFICQFVQASLYDLNNKLRNAIGLGQEKKVLECIKMGADLNYEQIDHLAQPIFLAIDSASIKIVKILIDHGALVTLKQFKTGRNLLHNLALNSRDLNIPDFKEKISLLVSLGVDINEQDSQGKTPLHWELMHGGDPQVLVELLKFDPNLSIKNNQDYIPFDYATNRYKSLNGESHEVILARADQIEDERTLHQLNTAKKIKILEAEIERRKLVKAELVDQLIENDIPREVAQIAGSYFF